jgi:DNA-binding XRE family transcriptional regulator
MSTENGKLFPDVGARLREERERLLLSQDAAGKVVGRDKKTIYSWECGTTGPTLSQLLSLMQHGFDVGYVLTGKRLPGLVVAEASAEYVLPAQRIAAEIAGMNLDQDDAEMLLAVARRLCK